MAKILLVEDDNNLREIYQARLTAEGYDIVAAQNGEEALVVAKQHKPDLIISDVMMPRISGFEMLDILRNTPELKATKVIMLTALGQAEDQTRAGKLGADRYLVKSQVTLEDIVSATRDMIEGATIVEPQSADAPTPGTPSGTTPPQTSAVLPPAAAVAVASDDDIDQTLLAATPTPPAQDLPATNTSTPAPIQVTDPDPITVQAPEEPAEEPAEATGLPPISTHTAPVLADTSATIPISDNATEPADTTVPEESESQANPTPVSTAAAESTAEASSQSLAAEEAAVSTQIAQFGADLPSAVIAPGAETGTPSPAAEQAAEQAPTSNDTMLASALEGLAASSKDGANASETSSETNSQVAVTPTPQPASTPDAAPAPSNDTTPETPPSEQVTVAGKKVIAPISNPEQKPDLQALLQKEEAIEQATATGMPPESVTPGSTPQGGAAPAVAPPPIIPETATASDPSSSNDVPATPVAQPAPAASPENQSTQPNKDGFDPNSIAL